MDALAHVEHLDQVRRGDRRLTVAQYRPDLRRRRSPDQERDQRIGV